MKLKLISLVLIALLAILQYPLWFGKGGLMRVHELNRQVAEQKSVNESLRLRNQQMEGDVRSLSDGVEAVEERARNDFGMVKNGEVYIQLVQPDTSKSNANPSNSKPSSADPKPAQ
ncbi:MAG TPA: cell division protein FtsB [Limnobacter sp.]|uniref:cell division protein FtsB n=1 Tax=Limnobacter sp. TaxID=2003368 RepID=UPI002E369BF0|nr:cell division protein FtsB [Limnobacter sp.]HEX5485979.1 cell division protein FtsB [Limnobacter sp.]